MAAEADHAPTAGAAVSAQRMRAAFSPAPRATALLQRTVPGSGAEVVALESAATISIHDGGQAEAKRPESALPGASAEPEADAFRGR